MKLSGWGCYPVIETNITAPRNDDEIINVSNPDVTPTAFTITVTPNVSTNGVITLTPTPTRTRTGTPTLTPTPTAT